MRICVLQCGTLPQTLGTGPSGYGHMFEDLLSEAGQTWDILHVENDDFPKEISAYDRFVITGSKHSVHDDVAWIRTLLDQIREIHRQERSLLGVCFGHQAIAQALGGEVRTNPRGWDIGSVSVSLTQAAKPFTDLSSLPDPFRILETHRDIVHRLPPGALHLARSHRTEHEMMFMKPSVFSLQGHPEFDANAIRTLVEDRQSRKVIGLDCARKALETLSLPPDRATLQCLLRGFLRTGALA